MHLLLRLSWLRLVQFVLGFLAAAHVSASESCAACVEAGGSWQLGECQTAPGPCPVQDTSCWCVGGRCKHDFRPPLTHHLPTPSRVNSREEALFQGYPAAWVGVEHARACCRDATREGADLRRTEIEAGPPLKARGGGGCRSPAQHNCMKVRGRWGWAVCLSPPPS